MDSPCSYLIPWPQSAIISEMPPSSNLHQETIYLPTLLEITSPNGQVVLAHVSSPAPAVRALV